MSSPTKNQVSDSKKNKDKNNKEEINDSEDEMKGKLDKNVKKNSGKSKKVKDVEKSDDENEDEEIKPGLLDLPLEVTGSRERKKVERLALSFHQPTKDKKIEISEGKGCKLIDCPRIEQQLVKFKAEALKPLHKLLFNRPGAPNEIKKNIRRFNGFVFENEAVEMDKKRGYLEKLTAAILKKMCDVLDLERSGTKDELISRILAFLLKPEPSGKSLPSKSIKKSSTTTKKSKKGKNSKSESSEDDHEDKNDDDDDKNDNSPDDGEKNDEEDKNEDEDEKKDESPDEKSSDKNIEDLKKATKKIEIKAKGKSKKQKLHSSESESSDDEPLVKKGKMPPTDEELKNFIKRILDGANLEEITMKTVCKQVYAKFPEFDLSSRKDFIKSTVRSIIS